MDIPLGINGKWVKERDRTLIHNSTAWKMERLVNTIPQNIRNTTGQTKDTFKRHLDKWLRNIPDTPKIDDCGITVGAENNSIIHQARYTMNNQNKWKIGKYNRLKLKGYLKYLYNIEIDNLHDTKTYGDPICVVAISEGIITFRQIIT